MKILEKKFLGFKLSNSGSGHTQPHVLLTPKVTLICFLINALTRPEFAPISPFPSPQVQVRSCLAFHISSWFAPALLPGLSIYFTSNIRFTFTDHTVKIPCDFAVLASRIFFPQNTCVNYHYIIICILLFRTSLTRQNPLIAGTVSILFPTRPPHQGIPSQSRHLRNIC